MKMRLNRPFALGGVFASVALVCAVGSVEAKQNENKINTATSEQMKSDKASAQSQKKIDKVAEKTRELLAEYRRTLKRVENTKDYNEQLRKLIESQKKEMVSVKEQIVSLKDTNKDIVPLMGRMIVTLEKFMELDTPFLPEERDNRLKNLKKMMDRADVSTSEKFRRILEAYQVENEYGRTIEAYRGTHKIDGKDRTVDFLRIGRVSLVYQTLGGSHSGFWNPKQKEWVALGSEFKKPITKGLRIARKQMAPDLVRMPVLTPEVL